jgi:hypothetical protein
MLQWNSWILFDIQTSGFISCFRGFCVYCFIVIVVFIVLIIVIEQNLYCSILAMKTQDPDAGVKSCEFTEVEKAHSWLSSAKGARGPLSLSISQNFLQTECPSLLLPGHQSIHVPDSLLLSLPPIILMFTSCQLLACSASCLWLTSILFIIFKQKVLGLKMCAKSEPYK